MIFSKCSTVENEYWPVLSTIPHVETWTETSKEIHKEAINLNLKLGKRKKGSVPENIPKDLLGVRQGMSALSQWLPQMHTANGDHNKLVENSSVVQALLEPLPLAFKVRSQKSAALDLMKMGRHDAMAINMTTQPPGSLRKLCRTTQECQSINVSIIQLGLQWYLDLCGERPSSKAEEPRDAQLCAANGERNAQARRSHC